MSEQDIAYGVRAVRERIDRVALAAGRDPASIVLLAATKSVAAEDVRAAARAGIDVVGENIAQEMLQKQDALAGAAEAAGLRWDFIGSLQKNKVGKVVGRVALIHGVDSLALAEAIDRTAAGKGLAQQALIEVNTSGEASKHGFSPEEAARAVERIAVLEHVDLRGAMTMAPPRNPRAARACFAGLAALVREPWWPAGATELSMGMSDDFEIAVAEGATIVRVGSAIFGARCGFGLGA